MHVRVVIIFLFVTVLLVGCSSPHQLPTAPTPIPRLIPATLPAGEVAPTAPAEATETPGEATEPSPGGDAAQGQQVFEANCAVCHSLSVELKVGPGMAGLFADQAGLPNGQPFSEENLREWIRDGGGAMPGIPLGETEMSELIAFLRQETQ
jgi:cytochrome c2